MQDTSKVVNNLNIKTIRANKARLIKGSILPSYARIMVTAQYEHFNVIMDEWKRVTFKDISSTTRYLQTTSSTWIFKTPSDVTDTTTLNNRRLPTISNNTVETGRYVYLWYTPINIRGVKSKTYIFRLNSTSTQLRFGALAQNSEGTPIVQYMDSYVHNNNELLGSGNHILVAKISSTGNITFFIDGTKTSRNFTPNQSSSTPLYWFFYNMSVGEININSIEVIERAMTDSEIGGLT